MVKLKIRQKLLIDSNDKCGKKLLITGNGHCNYWNENISIDKYETDDINTLEKIISEDNKNKVLSYLESIGIYPKIKNGYYYPYSNQATSIREIFENEINSKNITFLNNTKVQNITKINNKFIIETDKGQIEADKVIISAGSKAYPKTGSDGSGYKLAKDLGHKINPISPALTKLYSDDKQIKDWENVRCDVRLKLYINNKLIKTEEGEIHLTKEGISGICTFNISSLASKNLKLGNDVSVSINFMPDLKESFYSWFTKRNEKIKEKTIEELLESIFNYKLMFLLLKKANINKDSNWRELSEQEKQRLSNQIENFTLKITSTESFDNAQVCTGGVSLAEINPNTCESKIVPNLYFTGEILDVDGKCGGYNLAFAFITGFLAGRGTHDKNQTNKNRRPKR